LFRNLTGFFEISIPPIQLLKEILKNFKKDKATLISASELLPAGSFFVL